MIQSRSTPSLAPEAWTEVAEYVERYEQAAGDGGVVALARFLPAAGHPLRCRVAVELVRVDLERRWEQGRPRPLADYRDETPELFDDPALLSEAAYEEFRLRRQAGEQVSRDEYADRFGTPTDAWPRVEAPSLTGEVGRRADGVTLPAVGDSLAGFRLLRELGRGAFATVFLAEQNDLAHRPVALKVSRRRSVEPEHLARLQHTGIVPIYSVHESGGLTAVCMPYRGDRTLADVLRGEAPDVALRSTVARRHEKTIRAARKAAPHGSPQPALVTQQQSSEHRRLVIDDAVQLVRDLALALAHAHQRGIVHRDLKPANVLIGDDGRPLLLDFNLSDDATALDKESLTVGGTVPYMAPEHLLAVQTGGPIGEACDLYSLGVILFETLTGRRPFADLDRTGDDAFVEAQTQRSVPPPPASSLEPTVPASLDALVAKCLAPKPSDRYASADDLAEDLDRHLDSLPLRHASNPSWRERCQKWRRRHPRIASGGAVAAMSAALLAAVALLWVSRTDYLKTLEANAHFASFQERLTPARLSLSVPNTDLELLRDGVTQGEAALDEYVSEPNWLQSNEVRRLTPEHRRRLYGDLAELAYYVARGELLLSRGVEPNRAGLERALAANDLATGILGADAAAARVQREAIASLMADDLPAAPAFGVSHASHIESYLDAQQQLESGAYRAASASLSAVLTQTPTDPVAWLLTGNALAALGEFADAEAAFTLSHSLQPRSYIASYNRALCRSQRGRHAEAIADLDAVLELRPSLVCAMLNRGLARQALGQPDKALHDFDAAIATGNAPPRAYLLRSRLRRGAGDLDGAKRDLQAALALVPVDEAGWVARGIARLADDPRAALADFQTALRLYRGSRDALKNIVYVSADRLDLQDDAMRALDALTAANPGDASAFAGRAVLKARQGLRDESLKDVKLALAKSDSPLIRLQCACALSLTAATTNADSDCGLRLLSQALDQDPRLFARAAVDPDLKTLRSTDKFRRLADAYRDLATAKREILGGPGAN
ncbi:Serine/threonine-protein kinase PrkC [Posidoniimonas polymericola]|uniref:non-specific serine/threonine protein kinase n=1 Tax=Posidoniimonas polymericola TaxID=2528002 RepID=A0A5C5YL09_9BACT|nr:serine/threonine-protein kinase [Posidoniimonas polymericola]TWT75537.1 Serine/threonine-protein kinase PrkC [Posidoniimonas polymericola]